MRIVYLAAGAAGMHCGACARDVTLVRALMARGHDVLLMPLYTPLEVDGPDPSGRRIFYGGLNAYLEQKSALFRRRLPLIDRILSSRPLLRAVSRFAVNTRPEGLGAMTVSVLQGTEGRQAKELDRLVEYLLDGERPDVINLTNSLLSAVAPEIKRRLGVPVVCTLQGEESFIGQLPEPHGTQAHELVRRHAESIDEFISPHASYAAEMADWLNVPGERFRIVRPGVDLEAYRPGGLREPRRLLRVGFLSRIAPAKGADLVCRAFAELERRRPGAATLAMAGQLAPRDREWWNGAVADLAAIGLGERFEFRGLLAYDDKLAFLRGLDVFVQPSRMAERRGMAALEALASGVPIIVPRAGVFPEITELTGGGLLVEPDSADAVADALVRLVDDLEELARLSRAARPGVEPHFSADAMAEATLAVYRDLVSD